MTITVLQAARAEPLIEALRELLEGGSGVMFITDTRSTGTTRSCSATRPTPSSAHDGSGSRTPAPSWSPDTEGTCTPGRAWRPPPTWPTRSPT